MNVGTGLDIGLACWSINSLTDLHKMMIGALTASAICILSTILTFVFGVMTQS